MGALYGIGGLAIEQAIITPIRPVFPLIISAFFVKNLLEQFYFSSEFINSYKNWKPTKKTLTESDKQVEDELYKSKIIDEHVQQEERYKKWNDEYKKKSDIIDEYKKNQLPLDDKNPIKGFGIFGSN